VGSADGKVNNLTLRKGRVFTEAQERGCGIEMVPLRVDIKL